MSGVVMLKTQNCREETLGRRVRLLLAWGYDRALGSLYGLFSKYWPGPVTCRAYPGTGENVQKR